MALTMINETIVEASASSPARAIEAWRTSTRRASTWTTMWSTQKISVASMRAVAFSANLPSRASERSRPTAIPISEAAKRIPSRLKMRRCYRERQPRKRNAAASQARIGLEPSALGGILAVTVAGGRSIQCFGEAQADAATGAHTVRCQLCGVEHERFDSAASARTTSPHLRSGAS